MIKNLAMKAEMHIKFALLRHAAKAKFKSDGQALPNIILTGPARSGKSILSRRLASDLGYIAFRMDSVGGYAKAYTKRSERQDKMNWVVETLLNDIPNGLCIEGSTVLRGENYNLINGNMGEKFFRYIARSDALSEQQKYDAFIERHNEITLTEIIRMADIFHAKIVLVGSLEDPGIKAQGMLEHRAAGRCWSTAYCSDAEVYYLALDNHICSKRLKKLSEDHGLDFIDIDSKSFTNSIDLAVKKISISTKNYFKN